MLLGTDFLKQFEAVVNLKTETLQFQDGALNRIMTAPFRQEVVAMLLEDVVCFPHSEVDAIISPAESCESGLQVLFEPVCTPNYGLRYSRSLSKTPHMKFSIANATDQTILLKSGTRVGKVFIGEVDTVTPWESTGEEIKGPNGLHCRIPIIIPRG